MAFESSDKYKENGFMQDHGDEHTPFRTKTEDATIGDDTEHSREKSLCTRLKTDKCYREKYLTSLALLWAFIILGWVAAQVGPSFLDLQIITRTTLDKASSYLTSHSCGYLLGSFVMGLVYDKFNCDKKLLLVFVMLGYSLILSVLPWSKFFEIMIIVHIIKGFFGGGLDTVGNAHLVNMWGTDGRSFMQALHFAFAFGGILSPFAMAPFLAPESEKINALSSTTKDPYSGGVVINSSIDPRDSLYSVSPSLPTQMTENTSISSIDVSVSTESRIYIAYFITGALTITAAVPFIFLYIKYKDKVKTNKDKSEDENNNGKYVSLPLKVLILVVLMLLFGVYVAVEEGFNAFLATFCVKYLSWSKYDGSVITAVFWASFALGRFLGIFVVRFVRPVRMIFSLILVLILTFVGFFFSSFWKYDNGIWICAAVAGIAMSVIFPTIFTWTEEDILQVTGRVASLFMVSASAGAMISPLMLGLLMDKYSPMWFSYILLGFTIILFLLFLVALCLSFKTKLPKHTFRDVEIEIRSDTLDDLDQRSVICESEFGTMKS